MTSILKVDTIQDADGNNIINESGNTITIGASGDTTNIIGTLNKDGSAVANTPAFEATRSTGTTNISNNTFTKIQCDTEVFDTAGNYDNSSNYRFTPTTAGKYYVYGLIKFESDSAKRIEYCQFSIYKNGSQYRQVVPVYSADNVSWQSTGVISSTIDLNGSSDYVELYVRINVFSGSPNYIGGDNTTTFGAYKIIE